jgi:hypothetical protein
VTLKLEGEEGVIPNLGEECDLNEALGQSTVVADF